MQVKSKFAWNPTVNSVFHSDRQTLFVRGSGCFDFDKVHPPMISDDCRCIDDFCPLTNHEITETSVRITQHSSLATTPQQRNRNKNGPLE